MNASGYPSRRGLASRRPHELPGDQGPRRDRTALDAPAASKAFNGVRRFDDLCEHLDVPRASLARRLRELTEAGLLSACRTATKGRENATSIARHDGVGPVSRARRPHAMGRHLVQRRRAPTAPRRAEHRRARPPAVVAGRVEELAPTRSGGNPAFPSTPSRSAAGSTESRGNGPTPRTIAPRTKPDILDAPAGKVLDQVCVCVAAGSDKRGSGGAQHCVASRHTPVPPPTECGSPPL